MNPPLTD